jgi:hypothetical protein
MKGKPLAIIDGKIQPTMIVIDGKLISTEDGTPVEIGKHLNGKLVCLVTADFLQRIIDECK